MILRHPGQAVPECPGAGLGWDSAPTLCVPSRALPFSSKRRIVKLVGMSRVGSNFVGQGRFEGSGVLAESLSGASKRALLGSGVVGWWGLVFGHDWDQTPDCVGVTLVASHVHQKRGTALGVSAVGRSIDTQPWGCEPVRAGQAARRSCAALTLVSAHRFGQRFVDLACDVALQHPGDLTHGFAFRCAADDVVAGGVMRRHPHKHDSVDR